MLDVQGYTLVGPIRTTGSNQLFQAVRDTDGAHVILKSPNQLRVTSLERERYRREFSILQRLQGVAGVTRPVACELARERPVLILEHLEGTPLSDALGEPFSIQRFLELAIGLATTLAEIHLRGVIHKDIKPSNVLLTPTGQPRLIDFGAATLQRVEHVEAVPSTLIEGTLAYMSPEQTGRMNRAVDYRTDLYSLGVTFYEVLTGRKPFSGRDALEWFHAHMAVVPRPPRELNAAIPSELSTLVLKLLSKVAEERYQSATGLKNDLLRCQASLQQGSQEPFVLGAQDIPLRFQIPQRLYGRSAQVGTLLQALERTACGRRAELLLVSGYSGIGKSSVVHELHKPVVRQRGFFLSGKFDQFQRDVPYATLSQAIRGLVQHLLAGTDEELAGWRERLREAWKDEGQVLVELIPQLERVAGRQPSVPELPPTDALRRLTRVFQQFLGIFANAEHPLVVFLDDLQWADAASLQLLQHLLAQDDAPPVLWIGAYRDNEVGPAHPVTAMVTAVRKAGARVTDIHLAPLSLEQTVQLVSDALPGAEPGVVAPLAAQVHEKTDGNPFFLLQLMQALHQDGLLVRTVEGGWRWDAEGVRAKGYSDNVVDFLVGTLSQLPAETQHLLRLAACVGNSFPLSLLVIISSLEERQVEQDLEPALQEGLVMRTGPEHYRFLHDRIQQASHVLIPEAEREALHLRIGRLLLGSLSPSEVRERLFDIVSQFNVAVALLTDERERHAIARLNAEAGARARASSAHGSAVTYLTTAFALIPGEPWRTDPELAFKVRLERASSELMTGHSAEALQLTEELLSHARSLTEIADAYTVKNEILLIGGDIDAAASCLLECLARLGMPMKLRPTWEEVVAAHDEVWELLGERPIPSLLELPLMTDANTQVVMRVLSLLFAPAYFSDNNLLILHLCRMASLTIRYGNTDAAAHGYGWFGVITGFFFKRPQQGYAFGVLARQLVERYDLTAYRAKALLSLELVCYFNRPLAQAQEAILEASRYAQQTGDYQLACYSGLHSVWNRFAMGHSLDEVYEESVARLDFMSKGGFAGLQDVLFLIQRYVQQLRGRSHSFDTMSGADFDEASFEAGLTPAHMHLMQGWYWLNKMQSRFMCGAYEEARVASDEMGRFLWCFISIIQIQDYHLYRSLSLAASYEAGSPERRQQDLKELERHHQQLEEWAVNCPETFSSPAQLVRAERARLGGRLEEAMNAYEAAIRSARQNGFIQNVGLASELAANFYRKRQAPIIADAYAREARAAYVAWGAQGKVKHLDALWPHLVPSVASTSTTTTSTDSMQIDAITAVKAQQAISGEIVLERLVSTLMRVALENAGAQRGALLLPRGGRLAVVASAEASSHEATALSEQEAAQVLPWTLIAYVQRTHEHVLMGDASRPHGFPADPYLERSGVRSVLCVPMMRQERCAGVMYLENSLVSGAFTPARLSMMQHLASQAAISIENAELYAEVRRAEEALRRANDELERRVEARTHELKQAQVQLVDTARAAGMAEIASNVLHNVGNVLTSAVINLEQMRRAVGSSHAGKVTQVSALLAQHQSDLADFLSHDPRGSRLTEYLTALGEVLTREQAVLREDLEAMASHIEHIRSIVQVQQTYAKTSLMLDECDLSQLIEDALRLQNVSLRRHGVMVKLELTPVPLVRVDKHKVLQILINLLSNAKQAMDALPQEQRHLKVRLSVEGTMARLQVIDSGIGIIPEVRAKLFTHGFTTRKDGHGFGLHSSALAAKLLGGKLQIDSDGPGRGATATLELPLQ
ncbi:trifunctional serine/threonine-protein kinase/ATP-binding protein/sensor histidine kinase [Hyalangium gracile]|uniref:trifunctional serine/threonine-protein kinase/ATP-binding protein/sensor histidine kinase n=1 Tax=Hyalangium gracile TaxID=394092 RepID=UPI001CC9A6D6|nr:trifunctional serine/threonine-protein kinase/ATP-binding protein/sensor histidine kinase [Hyalangium gracile]